jgi:hypothetical protein
MNPFTAFGVDRQCSLFPLAYRHNSEYPLASGADPHYHRSDQHMEC